MPAILIRLDPARLANPDLDLRYDIPERLAQASGGLVKSSGFDYEDCTDAMLIYLSTSSVTEAMRFVVAMLDDEVVHGNRLADAAQVGVSELSPKEATRYTVVYPSGKAGALLP
ncbi:hypothetical protein LJR084_007857 [Variovorax sp. LjRoot84]|uniref:hypothetical protein n=1 Tax=Variovorax sp. LjRoot84 TaxID=3342340 RepID=UPI003ED0CD52